MSIQAFVAFEEEEEEGLVDGAIFLEFIELRMLDVLFEFGLPLKVIPPGDSWGGAEFVYVVRQDYANDAVSVIEVGNFRDHHCITGGGVAVSTIEWEPIEIPHFEINTIVNELTFMRAMMCTPWRGDSVGDEDVDEDLTTEEYLDRLRARGLLHLYEDFLEAAGIVRASAPFGGDGIVVPEFETCFGPLWSLRTLNLEPVQPEFQW